MNDGFCMAVGEGRRHFGSRLTIMGHHYQEESVIRHTDRRGDSLELARCTSAVKSPYIIFCGVYFMAESTALLARSGQEVHLPEPSAECSMALMSPPALLEKVLDNLARDGRRVIPLVYINSTLAVKAVAGRRHGATCTSANAEKMLAWAMREGDAVVFLPDGNLGANIADRLGLPETERVFLNLRDTSGSIPKDAARARLFLWPGFCSIHTRFHRKQIERVRAEYQAIKVVVHPECTPAVAAAADAVGSTAFIIRYVEELPAGAVVAIGTEINLVERLAAQHRG
ncbi:MAG: quinolinate synthase NadA, partial [Deltaproteobacteria bacterium]|nr:quinolinate synthase NadA [Deltaproteobacteria bacterium]